MDVDNLMKLKVVLYKYPSGVEPVQDRLKMVLLHGFIMKSQKTPLYDLNLARDRLARLRGDR